MPSEADRRRRKIKADNKRRIIIASYTSATPVKDVKEGEPSDLYPPSSFAVVMSNVHNKFAKQLKYRRWSLASLRSWSAVYLLSCSEIQTTSVGLVIVEVRGLQPLTCLNLFTH